MVNGLIEKKQAELAEKSTELERAEELLARKKLEQSELSELQEMIPCWRDEFDNASHDTKRVLLTKIIDRVIIYPERIESKMRVRVEDFVKSGRNGTSVHKDKFEKPYKHNVY